MCMTSMPDKIIRAQRIIGPVRRLMARWFCSTMLFRYFLADSDGDSRSALIACRAARFAPL